MTLEENDQSFARIKKSRHMRTSETSQVLISLVNALRQRAYEILLETHIINLIRVSFHTD